MQKARVKPNINEANKKVMGITSLKPRDVDVKDDKAGSREEFNSE